MILDRSSGYWTTGISVRWVKDTYRDENGDRTLPAWGATLQFFDDGFVDDDPDNGQISTQGELRTRYLVADGKSVPALRAVIDALLSDAERLDIQMGSAAEGPYLYYQGDGEDADYPPPDGWREMLAAEAERIGWSTPYKAAAKEA